MLALGMSDVAGLKEAATLTVNGQREVPFAPSLGVPTATQNGIHAKLAAPATRCWPRPSADQAVRVPPASWCSAAPRRSTFAPVARDTRLAMTSDWPHPSFSGAFLPLERSIGADGFSASWRVPHLARSVPQAWSLATAGARPSSAPTSSACSSTSRSTSTPS